MRIIPHVFGTWDDVSITGALELDGRYGFKWLPALEDDGQEVGYMALGWRWDSGTSFSQIIDSHRLIQARQADSIEATCASRNRLSLFRADLT